MIAKFPTFPKLKIPQILITLSTIYLPATIMALVSFYIQMGAIAMYVYLDKHSPTSAETKAESDSNTLDLDEVRDTAETFVLQEMRAQLIFTALFFLRGHWFAMFVNLPLAVFHVEAMVKKRYILNEETGRATNYHYKVAKVKFVFYIFTLVLYFSDMIRVMAGLDI